MSNREFAKNLIDHVPENKLLYVVAYLQGVVVPDKIPNAETLASMSEIEDMIQNGGGEHFKGSTADLLSSILAGDD